MSRSLTPQGTVGYQYVPVPVMSKATLDGLPVLGDEQLTCRHEDRPSAESQQKGEVEKDSDWDEHGRQIDENFVWLSTVT